MGHIDDDRDIIMPSPDDQMGINAVDQYTKATKLTSVEAAANVPEFYNAFEWRKYSDIIKSRRRILETAIATEFKAP